MKKTITLLFLLFFILNTYAQNINQIKKNLQALNGQALFEYVSKAKLKYKIDTINIITTKDFMGIADSIAYKSSVGSVHGPFKKDKILLKLLIKAPNTFYHVKQIIIDTSIFQKKIADSIAQSIIVNIKNGNRKFADYARIYSKDTRLGMSGGEVGWFTEGALIPQIDKELSKAKKGSAFKFYTGQGLHIVYIPDAPKKDYGYALFLRVIL